MDTKVCKKCGIERDRDLFNKKGKNKSPRSRVSTCRICQSKNGIVYSVYNYPTDEMNKIATKNTNSIIKKLFRNRVSLYKKEVRIKVCKRCNVGNVSYNKSICTTCRKKEDKRRRKEGDRRRITLVKDAYIKKLFKESMIEYEIKPHDIPKELLELKRKQILLTRKLKKYGKEEN